MRVYRALMMVLAFSGLGASVAHGQRQAGRGVCAAFASNGSFAQARLGRNSLNLEIQSSSQPATRLAMPLISSGNACHAFFSSDDQLLAVSIEDTDHPRANVQVAVADTVSGRWLQSAPYAAMVAEDARGPLVGFLGDTHTLWLMSEGTFFPDEERSLLYPVLINLPEGAVRVGLLGFTGPPFSPASGNADSRNRTVWFSTRQDACGFGWQVLGDKDEVKPGGVMKGDALRAQGCVQADHVLAITPSDLLVGFSVANRYKIARFDLTSGKNEVVWVKAMGREGFFKGVRTAVSPEAKYAAVEVLRFDDTRAGIRRAATEILLLRTEPFGLVTTVQVAPGTDLLALGARGGAIQVALLDSAGKVSVVQAH